MQLANIHLEKAVYGSRKAPAFVSATQSAGKLQGARNMSRKEHIRAGISSFFPLRRMAGVGDLDVWITQVVPGCRMVKLPRHKNTFYVAPEIRRKADP